MTKHNKRRKSRAKPGSLPKGSYRLPTGGVATAGPVHSMPNGRRISVIAIRRETPNFEQLARALLEIAKAEIAAEQDQLDEAA